jgi:ribonucleoside-diphosphate reductase alpha chain
MKPNLTENALKILKARYLKKNEQGHTVESPEEMFKRVAHHVSSAEKIFDWSADIEEHEERFYRFMASLEFLPNSPTLMNAGRDLGQLSACFVLPVEDSLISIFQAVQNTALIHKSGGGTGFSFSRLRPKNDIVSTTSGVASGPVSFMEIFNTATDVIKQGGTRRGANMGVLRVDHPDIEEFIQVKKNPSKLGSFNLSVGITKEFMDAVIHDRNFDLIDPKTRTVTRTLKAKKLFELIADCAWETGEPGLLFLDHINNDNPTPHLGEIECTNPCGEQPLLPYEACNLGSINLVKMVKRTADKIMIDWDKISDTVFLAVRFLDNVIEINNYPLAQIEKITRGNRKIGLGVMGFAHLLIHLGIPYGSQECIELADRLMGYINRKAHEASQQLANMRGVYPNFKKNGKNRWVPAPTRNATATTIAPTGTLSLIADCSSGIEPLYALSYTRIIAGDIEITEMDPVFRQVSKENGFLTLELEEFVRKTGSLPRDLPLPDWFCRLFATAFDIEPLQHVKIQAAFQHYTDNAVSKTINFPSSVSQSEIKDAMLLAYELGCKGITVYRDGSRAGQVLRCGLGKIC